MISVVINITESASSFVRRLDESSFDIPRAALRNTKSSREFRRAFWEIVIHVSENNNQAGCAEFCTLSGFLFKMPSIS